MAIVIDASVSIPESELSFIASRSAGPGGQNVNKVNSRITLRFDVAQSPSLSETQRARVMQRLATRINSEGVLQLSSQTERTQAGNRKRAVERFVELLQGAVREKPRRKKTRVSRAVKEKRLEDKKRLSERKVNRRKME